LVQKEWIIYIAIGKSSTMSLFICLFKENEQNKNAEKYPLVSISLKKYKTFTVHLELFLNLALLIGHLFLFFF
jgi:hypothetical protein